MSHSNGEKLASAPGAARREYRRVTLVFGAIILGFLLGIGLLLSVVAFGL